MGALPWRRRMLTPGAGEQGRVGAQREAWLGQHAEGITPWHFADPNTALSCTFPENTKYFIPQSGLVDCLLYLQRAPSLGAGTQSGQVCAFQLPAEEAAPTHSL